MKAKVKKQWEKVLNRFPSNRIIFGLITAIILGTLLYVVILMLVSR